MAAKIARQHYLKPSRPGFFRVVFRAGLSPIFAERLVAGKVLGRRRNKTEHQQRWAVGRVFGLKGIGFEGLLELKSILEFQLPTSHLQNAGGWKETQSLVLYCNSVWG